MLERAVGEEILGHPLYYLDPPLPSYVRGNVALPGDAAHAIVPVSAISYARRFTPLRDTLVQTLPALT